MSMMPSAPKVVLYFHCAGLLSDRYPSTGTWETGDQWLRSPPRSTSHTRHFSTTLIATLCLFPSLCPPPHPLYIYVYLSLHLSLSYLHLYLYVSCFLSSLPLSCYAGYSPEIRAVFEGPGESRACGLRLALRSAFKRSRKGNCGSGETPLGITEGRCAQPRFVKIWRLSLGIRSAGYF